VVAGNPGPFRWVTVMTRIERRTYASMSGTDFSSIRSEMTPAVLRRGSVATEGNESREAFILGSSASRLRENRLSIAGSPLPLGGDELKVGEFLELLALD
jgi:hypothetical protein